MMLISWWIFILTAEINEVESSMKLVLQLLLLVTFSPWVCSQNFYIFIFIILIYLLTYLVTCKHILFSFWPLLYIPASAESKILTCYYCTAFKYCVSFAPLKRDSQRKDKTTTFLIYSPARSSHSDSVFVFVWVGVQAKLGIPNSGYVYMKLTCVMAKATDVQFSYYII